MKVSGSWFKELRTSYGLDVPNFARLVGVAQGTAYRWEASRSYALSGAAYHLLRLYSDVPKKHRPLVRTAFENHGFRGGLRAASCFVKKNG